MNENEKMRENVMLRESDKEERMERDLWSM